MMVPSSNTHGIRRVVVVLGMHRSGTSVVAACLRRLGIDFGPRLMPPNADNPRGYFEHNDVVNLHDRLLLALDRSWDDPAPLPAGPLADPGLLAPYREELLTILRRDFPAAPLWGLKDPRLCRLLPWWETIWPEIPSHPLFLLVRRHPAEVAASLARRDGMSTPKASLLWLQHTLEAERATRTHERILLDFADFLRDEDAALAPVRHALGLPARTTETGAPVVDPTLGRPGAADNATFLSPWTHAADEALLAGLAGQEILLRQIFDDLTKQLEAAEPFLLQPPDARATDLSRQLADSRKQARWYEAEWRKARGRVDALKSKLEARKSS